ncbi:MAG: hypothetical protein HC896_10000 [Bacteroidales bacterium]|nr:hypothetical protein [Bacteroidales bacterium]
MKRLVFIVLTLVAVSCEKPGKVSIVPYVEYKAFSYSDTTVQFFFEDGDGDISFPADIYPPYTDSNGYQLNLVLEYYSIDTAGYTKYTPPLSPDQNQLSPATALPPCHARRETIKPCEAIFFLI